MVAGVSGQRRTVVAARQHRDLPYADAHAASRAAAWDVRRRAPRDLRQAVRYVRAAWIAETPVQLHDGEIGDDGKPRFAGDAYRFVFGAPDEIERESNGRLGYRWTPFRATLATFRQGDDRQRAQAAIVASVTAGEQGPGEAAANLGVPRWCAKLVAFDALTSFLGSMTDVVVVGGG